MKRLIFLITSTALLSIVSCQKAEFIPIDSQTDMASLCTTADSHMYSLDRFVVSLSDAERYAELYKPGETYTVTPYVEGRDTLLYFINYKEGWVVLSGDRRMNPVFAQDAQGSIAMNDETTCGFWLKLYAEEVLRLKNDIREQDNDYTSIWKAISPKKDNLYTRSNPKWVIREVVYNENTVFDAVVPVMLQTKWGQQAPWNNNYPLDNNYNNKCYVGCVAIAVSQVLYYWHSYVGTPTELSHTVSCYSTINSNYGDVHDIGFSRSDVTSNSTRWNDMALSASSGGNTGYVGDFMLDIGNMVNMGYSGAGSVTTLNNYLTTLQSRYGVTYSYGPYNESLVKTHLQNNRPVIVSGNSTNNEDHCWVIDGRMIEYQYYSMLRYCELSSDWGPDDEVYDTFAEAQAVYGFSEPYEMLPFSRTITIDRFHMNWGEDGIGDSWFACSSNWYCSSYNSSFSPASLYNYCCIYY